MRLTKDRMSVHAFFNKKTTGMAWVHIETLGGSGPIFCSSDVYPFGFFYSCVAQPFLL